MFCLQCRVENVVTLKQVQCHHLYTLAARQGHAVLVKLLLSSHIRDPDPLGASQQYETALS
jgi:hypothetical protein